MWVWRRKTSRAVATGLLQLGIAVGILLSITLSKEAILAYGEMQQSLAAASAFGTISHQPAIQAQGGVQIMGTKFHPYRYGPATKQVFYLAQPACYPTSTKLAILVHGGNFLYGSALDSNMLPLAKFFLERGYWVASVDYRTLVTEKWPTPVLDTAEGIAAVLKRLEGQVTDVTYVGFSAGAVSGALLLYSDQFPDIPQIDKFIGISGLYNHQAVGEAPIQAIQQSSMERLDILRSVTSLVQPKTQTPALLIEGTHDYFADKYPNTPQSHAASLENLLQRSQIYAKSYWISREGFNDHIGPLGLIASEEKQVTTVLENFLHQAQTKPLISDR